MFVLSLIFIVHIINCVYLYFENESSCCCIFVRRASLTLTLSSTFNHCLGESSVLCWRIAVLSGIMWTIVVITLQVDFKSVWTLHFLCRTYILKYVFISLKRYAHCIILSLYFCLCTISSTFLVHYSYMKSRCYIIIKIGSYEI